MNRQLHEKFHLETNLSAVFIDSYAKQDWSFNDPGQQEAFNRETLKLWNFFSNNHTFEFKTIQDVLDENQRLKEENQRLNETVQCLNDVIAGNISDIYVQLHNVRTDIVSIKLVGKMHS